MNANAKEALWMEEVRKAVVTVLGIDRKGIIARISDVLYRNDVNILDISQTVMQDYFHMILIADITGCAFDRISDQLSALGTEMGLQIRIQRSEIFEAMHQV